MGDYFKAVIRVEARVKVTETIKKSKRIDYVGGGFRLNEVIHRETTEEPYALLECGHWQGERSSGPGFIKAKKLACNVCEKLKWDKKHGR